MSLRTPKYRLHKASGQALVQFDGQRIYLGKHGTEESKEKYWRVVAEWLASRRRPGSGSTTHSTPGVVTINELLLAFWCHAKERYVKNGEPTSETRSFRAALRPVRQLYGRQPVTEFGPLALVACRQKLVEASTCRKRINQHVGRIRHVFKWGVARELVPETVWRALCAVEGLRVGEAIETEPVKPVPEERIAAIQPFLSPQVWAMVNLQLWSGCRPGEACLMRTIDINTQGRIWEYRPHLHKTEHHQKERVVYLGPHAQEVIKPWLKPDLYAYLFSPAEAREWHLAERAKKRKTPPKRTQTPRKENPERAPGDRYTEHAYNRAIDRVLVHREMEFLAGWVSECGDMGLSATG